MNSHTAAVYRDEARREELLRRINSHPAAIYRDEARREELLRRIPRQWRGKVARGHRERMNPGKGWREIGERLEAFNSADNWLREIAGRIGKLRVQVDLSDADLCRVAEEKARECMNLAGNAWLKTPEGIRARLARFVEGYGIRAPAEKVKDGPALARMTCQIWWRRGLRASQARELERAAIGLGYVHRQAEIYASDATVERRKQQLQRNAAALEATQAINMDTGEVLALEKLVAASVANPRIRRGELMTRISGFEQVARGLGHAGEFITLTCPSLFHPQRVGVGGKVEPNPKHAGATPREAQGYLVKIWAAIRAKLQRLGVRPYGFRIAEPHHDGTPHWHLLLFVEASKVEQLRAVVRDYALRMDGDETGAQKNRVEFVSIDFARGSAAGYVAKYVAKNIDGGGYSVQGDLEGGQFDAITPAHRVEAWASTWGIRQFQQIGGPPVGVWRELRRIKRPAPNGIAYSGKVLDGIEAADCGPLTGHGEKGAAGNWRRYVEVQGGPVVDRKNLAIRAARTEPGECWDYAEAAPFPAPPNRYGEPAAPVVFGVVDVESGAVFASLRDRWEIRREKHGKAEISGQRGKAAGISGAGEVAGPEFGFTIGMRSAGDVHSIQEERCYEWPFVTQWGFWGTRTRVNNCTQGGGDGGNSERENPGGTGFEPEIRRGSGIEHADGAAHAGASGGSIAPAGRDSRGTGISSA